MNQQFATASSTQPAPLVSENLGLLFPFGHHQAREQRATGAVQRAASDVAHDFGVIIVFAQVSQDERADGRIQIDANEIRHDVVRQVALAAHDSLLHGPRIRADLEHFEIVVGFQHQQVGATQMKLDGIRQVAEIGNDTDLDSVGTKAESHWINGIVGDGKTVDFDVADGECGAGLKAIELGGVLAPGDGGSR